MAFRGSSPGALSLPKTFKAIDKQKRKRIAIFGATGRQGGSVLHAIANSPDYQIRAITRFTDGEPIQKLKTKFPDIEIAYADLNDVNSMITALTDCYGCFGVTFTPYSFLPVEKWYDFEFSQGKHLADACAIAKISHIVYSTVVHTGAIEVLPQLAAKRMIFEYMLREKHLHASGIMMCFYYDNLIHVFRPTILAKNEFGFRFPLDNGKQAQASVSDTGIIVKYLFDHRNECYGEVIPLVGELVTVELMIDVLNKYLAPVHFTDMKLTLEEFANLSIPLAGTLATLLTNTIVRDDRLAVYEAYKVRCRKFNPKMMTFEGWVIQNLETLKEIFST